MRQLLPVEVAVNEVRVARTVQHVRDERLTPTHTAELRRREFEMGRACASRALEMLGETVAPVPRSHHGGPLWPGGIVGSITHCLGYVAAAVGRSSLFASIGIDAEPNEPTSDGVLALIASQQEIRRLKELYASKRGVHWSRVLFSAKEAVYKAWFPLEQRWIGFQDVDVSINPDGTFLAELNDATSQDGRASVDHFEGRWVVDDQKIHTAVVVQEDCVRRAAVGVTSP